MCGDLFGTVLAFGVHGVITVFLFVVDVFIFIFLLMGDRPGTIASYLDCLVRIIVRLLVGVDHKILEVMGPTQHRYDDMGC